MVKLYLFVRRYLAVVMLMGAFSAFAQQSVSGKVTSSDDGSGIPGVNILEKGTSNGTVSDADGNYTISVGANATLVFSFVGYAAQEVAVGSQTSVNVSMKSDITSLSEVVVIGYGEISKKDLTGAVASVKSEDFIKGVISSPEQLIQGKTAGVQITSASGEPGAGVNVRIRGTSSVRGGNNPLFVVDGIPLTGDDVSPGGADLGRGSSSAASPGSRSPRSVCRGISWQTVVRPLGAPKLDSDCCPGPRRLAKLKKPDGCGRAWCFYRLDWPRDNFFTFCFLLPRGSVRLPLGAAFLRAARLAFLRSSFLSFLVLAMSS